MKKKMEKINTVDELQASLNKIKDILADTKDEMQGRASEAISEVIDSLNEHSSHTEDFKKLISDKPLQSVIIALLAGLVIGKLIL